MRFTAFKVLGGLLFVLSCLGMLSVAVTLTVQLLFPVAFADLPPAMTLFTGAMSVLLAYVGWRIATAKPLELRPFSGMR